LLGYIAYIYTIKWISPKISIINIIFQEPELEMGPIESKFKGGYSTKKKPVLTGNRKDGVHPCKNSYLSKKFTVCTDQDLTNSS
jgi:hypothetical protein